IVCSPKGTDAARILLLATQQRTSFFLSTNNGWSRPHLMRPAASLARQEHRERLFDVALQILPVRLIARVSGADLAELDVLELLQRYEGDRRGDRRELRAVSGLQRRQYAVHLTVDRRPRHDDQPVLPLNVCDEVDVAGLVRHGHQTLLGECRVDALGFAEDET